MREAGTVQWVHRLCALSRSSLLPRAAPAPTQDALQGVCQLLNILLHMPLVGWVPITCRQAYILSGQRSTDLLRPVLLRATFVQSTGGHSRTLWPRCLLYAMLVKGLEQAIHTTAWLATNFDCRALVSSLQMCCCPHLLVTQQRSWRKAPSDLAFISSPLWSVRKRRRAGSACQHTPMVPSLPGTTFTPLGLEPTWSFSPRQPRSQAKRHLIHLTTSRGASAWVRMTRRHEAPAGAAEEEAEERQGLLTAQSEPVAARQEQPEAASTDAALHRASSGNEKQQVPAAGVAAAAPQAPTPGSVVIPVLDKQRSTPLASPTGDVKAAAAGNTACLSICRICLVSAGKALSCNKWCMPWVADDTALPVAFHACMHAWMHACTPHATVFVCHSQCSLDKSSAMTRDMHGRVRVVQPFP